jgi:hypothetical protein
MAKLDLYGLKEVVTDFIVLTNGTTDVKISFADAPPEMDFINRTKEERFVFWAEVRPDRLESSCLVIRQ